MKKFYFLGLIVIAGQMLRAQSSLTVTHEGNPIANGATIYRTTALGVENIYDINVKNTSASTKSYKFRKYEDMLNSGSDAFFCVQACYPPTTMVSPTALALNANQDANAIGVMPSLHMTENTSVGQSDIRYRIYDENNPTDEFVLTIKYNSPVSVKSNSLFTGISDVYPNPSSSKAYLNMVAATATNAKMTITNSLGAIVSTKLMDINQGKNILSIDVDNLSDGIYFVALTSGNTVITKRITVSK
jgi:hypothetical protein